MSLINSNQEAAVQTREQVKKVDHDQEKKQARKKGRRIRVRLIPIWLRIIIVVVLTVLSAAVGVIVGYGVIGDGKPSDALKKSTWTHITDLINKEK